MSSRLAARPGPDPSTAPGAFLFAGAIPNLDGLRAISVMLVMLSHFGFGDKAPGGLGVTAFFFLSGFLITTLLLRERGGSGVISLRNFYIRRLLRLQPELLACLAGSAVIGILYIGFPRSSDFLSATFYVTNYVDALAKMGVLSAPMRWPQLWSLAVEEHFYLAFPLCISFFGPDAVRRLCIPFLAAVLLWRIALTASGAPAAYTYVATDTRIDSIGYGCLTALWLWRTPTILDRCDKWIWPLLAIAGALVAATLAFRAPWFRETLRYSLQGVALSLGWIALLTPRGLRASAFLEWPAMKWIGRMSYGAYLWHLEPRHIFDHATGRAGGDLSFGEAALLSSLGIPASLFLAALSARLVYRPLLGLRRRYGSHAS